jgi:hypothetical protein
VIRYGTYAIAAAVVALLAGWLLLHRRNRA